LALGLRLNVVVATTDAAWHAADVRPEIVLIR
jgi:PIN domain nuclease of toxin-antitoxin system